jgi:hypothetical protein
MAIVVDGNGGSWLVVTELGHLKELAMQLEGHLGGTEFKNSQIEGFLEDEGIKHEFSSPYTPQQNGVVERKNRTLLDMASERELGLHLFSN